LTNIEGGLIASTNGGTQEIRDFAKKITNDQRKMSGYIKKMALFRDINLPDQSDEEKEWNKLASLSGKKFDRRFLTMVIDDRKRDLELFRKAATSADPDVREFAESSIPVIENHLKRARELK